jgi:protein O-mannosyl-transferase
MLDKINIKFGRQQLIICAVLMLITLAVFWQVRNYDFVNFDDPVYVTQNIHIQRGITLDGIRWAFTTTYAEFWHPPDLAEPDV